MATCALTEFEFVRDFARGVAVKTRNYGSTPTEKTAILTSFISRTFNRGAVFTDEFVRGEMIIGITNAAALQSYAIVYETNHDLNLDQRAMIMARIYDIFKVEPDLRASYVSHGSRFNRFKAMLSGDKEFKCLVLLGKSARLAKKRINPGAL